MKMMMIILRKKRENKNRKRLSKIKKGMFLKIINLIDII